MMPPICAICGKRDETGKFKIIYFKLTKSDRKWDEDMKKKDMVGHPPYAVWYCEEHAKVAEKYQNLHRKDAMKLILEEIEKTKI